MSVDVVSTGLVEEDTAPKKEEEVEVGVDVVEVEAPDGRILTVGRPNIATGFLIAQILGNEGSQSNIMFLYTKALMYLMEIDGKPVARPTQLNAVKMLANELGDEAMDLLVVVVNKYWGGPGPDNIKVIKKSSRGSRV